jgi:hypothetical protein
MRDLTRSLCYDATAVCWCYNPSEFCGGQEAIMKNADLNILFIDITKTAGTAITESFQRQFPNYTFEGKHHSIQNFLAYGSHILDDTGRPHKGTCSDITPQDLKDCYTFSVVRNPYDRMVSLWLWGCQNVYGPDFDLFVRNIAHNKYHDFNRVRYRSQAEWISDAEGKVRVQHLLRYETLALDFKNFLKKIGIEPFPLLIRNTALDMSKKERKSFQSYYKNKSTRQTVEDLWAADFQMFNYEKM